MRNSDPIDGLIGLSCIRQRLNRRRIRSKGIDLSAIEERQDLRQRRITAIDPLSQGRVDVQERRIVVPRVDRAPHAEHPA